VPISATGIRGAPRGEREARRTSLVAAFLIGQRRPFGKDADARATLEESEAGGDGPPCVRAAVDGESPGAMEDLLDAGDAVQLGLCHEPHLPRDGDAQEEAVHHRDVVRGEHAGACLRHVLAAGDLDAVDGHEERPQELLEDRVDGAIGVG
jgi:hypothetical protein